MSDLYHLFKHLRRPRLLIQAARSGAALYRRDRDLGRLLRLGRLPEQKALLHSLMVLEGEADTARRAHDATYSISRHVELLTALLSEAHSFKGYALS